MYWVLNGQYPRVVSSEHYWCPARAPPNKALHWFDASQAVTDLHPGLRPYLAIFIS